MQEEKKKEEGEGKDSRGGGGGGGEEGLTRSRQRESLLSHPHMLTRAL